MEKFTPQHEETDSIPLMVTREMNQSLADLGWKKEERNKLTPVAAHEIIKNQTRFVEEEKTEESDKDLKVDSNEGENENTDWVFYSEEKKAEKIPGTKDLESQRYEHAFNALKSSPRYGEMFKLALLEKDLNMLDAYIRKNEASLSPVEVEFLQASIAHKTKLRKTGWRKILHKN